MSFSGIPPKPVSQQCIIKMCRLHTKSAFSWTTWWNPSYYTKSAFSWTLTLHTLLVLYVLYRYRYIIVTPHSFIRMGEGWVHGFKIHCVCLLLTNKKIWSFSSVIEPPKIVICPYNNIKYCISLDKSGTYGNPTFQGHFPLNVRDS